MNEIKLPPPPKPLKEFLYISGKCQDLYGIRELQAYTRAAIEADRQARCDLVSMTSDAAIAAIQFALETDEAIPFLHCWNEGDFDVIRKEWPECPEAAFIGADPQHPETRAMLEADRQVRGEPTAQTLNPITAYIMRDDSGERPVFCVMAAYLTMEEAKSVNRFARGETIQKIPEGYALVPVDPTKEMLHAAATSGGLGMDYHEYVGRFTLAYKAAIKESLKN